MTIDFKPSDVTLGVPPLTATMGKTEIECAAALIVRTCQAQGDRWQPVSWKMARETLTSDLEAGRHPGAGWARNPFFRPDVAGLVAKGYATRGDGDDVELTAQGLEALRRWVRLSPADDGPETQP